MSSFEPPGGCENVVRVSNLDEIDIEFNAENLNVDIETRILNCEEDSITVCPPASGVFDVEVVQSVLPDGAATQVTLESLRANFATYRTNLEARDLATNSTLVQVRDYLDTVETKLQEIIDALGGGGGATEATLVQVRDYLDTVETKLQSVIDAVDGVEGVLGTTTDAEAAAGNGTMIALLKNLRTRLSNLEGYLDGVESSLTTLNAKDFATQTTLAAVFGAVDGLEGATGTTADAEASAGDGSIIALLKNLRTRLGALEGYTDGIETALATLNAKDFATQTTLESFRANFATYRTNLEARDLATDTSVVAVRDRLPAALDADGGLKAHIQNTIPVTVASQLSTSVDAMSATLDSILSGIRRPLYWDRINNRLFIGTIPGGTIDTVTTVTSLTALNSLNNFGSYAGSAQVGVKDGLLDRVSRATWSNVVRGRIS